MLVTAGALLLTLVLGGFVRELANIAAVRGRAQLAADAASLAAVAESGPYGGASPRAAANRFARANGATLTECACVPGSTEMQVEVAIEGIVARARSVIELDLIAPAQFAYGAQGLHARLGEAVDRLVRASGGRVWIESAYRDPQHQRELWAEALRKYGDPEIADDWVAPPGHSMHERGLAVDLGGDVALAARLVERMELPMWRPMPWEEWHFELVGSRS